MAAGLVLKCKVGEVILIGTDEQEYIRVRVDKVGEGRCSLKFIGERSVRVMREERLKQLLSKEVEK